MSSLLWGAGGRLFRAAIPIVLFFFIVELSIGMFQMLLGMGNPPLYTGSINTGSANVFVIGRTNALQQYFMLTLSWFPRKFGLK